MLLRNGCCYQLGVVTINLVFGGKKIKVPPGRKSENVKKANGKTKPNKLKKCSSPNLSILTNEEAKKSIVENKDHDGHQTKQKKVGHQEKIDEIFLL